MIFLWGMLLCLLLWIVIKAVKDDEYDVFSVGVHIIRLVLGKA